MKKNKYGPSPQLSVTSLLDLTMMLLLIFMIISPLMNAQVDISLPKSAAAQPSDESTVEINIDKNGSIFIGNTPVSLEEFPLKIKEMKEGANLSSVALKADKGVPYGTVMRVVGYIKDAGIVNLGLVAIPEKRR